MVTQFVECAEVVDVDDLVLGAGRESLPVRGDGDRGDCAGPGAGTAEVYVNTLRSSAGSLVEAVSMDTSLYH
ncbi:MULTISPECIES: hypothetical protein [unclassified Kitasatospora]|uniref:hypothetical protein n=1 Tax=unclassified Kitasatospora TaxID=2633591 RepID=UPI003424BF39